MNVGELRELLKGRDQDAVVWICTCYGSQCGEAAWAGTNPVTSDFEIQVRE